MQPDLDMDFKLKRVSLACAAMSIAISLIVLIGCGTNHLILTQYGYDYKSTPMIVALVFLILNGNLLAYLFSPKNPVLKLSAMIGLSIAVIAILVILIDDLMQTTNVSKASPILLTADLLIACALFVLNITEHYKTLAAWLSTIVWVFSSLILIGYLYGSSTFTYLAAGQVTTVALPAAIASFFLSIGLITAIGKNHLPLRAFIGPSPYARLMRATIPLIVLLSIIQNELNIVLYPLHLAGDYSITAAFISTLSAILLSILLSKIAFKISTDIEQEHQAFIQTQEKLEEALSYNRGLIEASLDPLVVINKKGKIIDVNYATERETGLKRQHLIGTDFTNYFTEPKRAKKGYEEALSKGVIKDYELTLQNTSGQCKTVLYNAVVYKNTAGKTAGIFAAARDITQRKKIEIELQQFTSELKRSNEELQQFAYVASHDLQEPLRVISSYLQLIERRYKDKLDQDANDFIYFAVDGANRLQRMINDLLAYSRVESKGTPFAPVDANILLKQALANIKLSIEENHAVITYDMLPTILADEDQLVTVFENLLSNAIKFHKPELPPIIHISVKEKASEWIFNIRDNGIGIDLQYKDKLFVIFKRLVGKEYSGSGIGLAICKRIITRHGGIIWVESELGHGSTFYFTLPKEHHQTMEN